MSRTSLAEAAASYLGKFDAKAQPSPLIGDISPMPPVRADVGDSEVLLDDSLRFAKRADQAGVSCEVHVWEGMIHVFPSSFAMLQTGHKPSKTLGHSFGGCLTRGEIRSR